MSIPTAFGRPGDIFVSKSSVKKEKEARTFTEVVSRKGRFSMRYSTAMEPSGRTSLMETKWISNTALGFANGNIVGLGLVPDIDIESKDKKGQI